MPTVTISFDDLGKDLDNRYVDWEYEVANINDAKKIIETYHKQQFDNVYHQYLGCSADGLPNNDLVSEQLREYSLDFQNKLNTARMIAGSEAKIENIKAWFENLDRMKVAKLVELQREQEKIQKLKGN